MINTQELINFFISNTLANYTTKVNNLKAVLINNNISQDFIGDYINNYLIYDLQANFDLEKQDAELIDYITEWKTVFEFVINNVETYSKRLNRNDKSFREKVKKNAEYKCQVSNYHIDTYNNLDVAHIYDFANCNHDYEKYDPCNGLLLRCDIHRAWDEGKLCINYNKELKQIFFIHTNKNIETNDEYIRKFEGNNNTIILININIDYFDNYCKYIDMRNNI
jgi:hypothetical protein